MRIFFWVTRPLKYSSPCLVIILLFSKGTPFIKTVKVWRWLTSFYLAFCFWVVWLTLYSLDFVSGDLSLWLASILQALCPSLFYSLVLVWTRLQPCWSDARPLAYPTSSFCLVWPLSLKWLIYLLHFWWKFLKSCGFYTSLLWIDPCYWFSPY